MDYSLLLIPAVAFNNLLPEVLIAAHQSKNLATALLIGSLARFPVLFGTIYILSAPPTIATIIAYSSTLFITPVLCCIYLRNILLEPFNVIKNVRATLQNILSAGIASLDSHTCRCIWFPTWRHNCVHCWGCC